MTGFERILLVLTILTLAMQSYINHRQTGQIAVLEKQVSSMKHQTTRYKSPKRPTSHRTLRWGH